MIKAKDGDFFISDWLRNRNTVEYMGIRESIHNPDFNYGEFAIIKGQAGLNSYKISVKEWCKKTGKIMNFYNTTELHDPSPCGSSPKTGEQFLAYGTNASFI